MNKQIVYRQLLNVIFNPRALFDKKVKKLCIFIIEKVTYSDGTKIKRISKILDPTIRYYVSKPDHLLEHPVFYIKKEYCDEYESRLADLDNHIATLTGQENAFHDLGGPGANKRRKVLHLHPDLHGSDVRIVDHYISRYFDRFSGQTDPAPTLDIAFSDIEIDHHDYEGFPSENEAPCPINIISYFHRPTRILYQFHNLGTDNPSQKEFLYPKDDDSEKKRCQWMLGKVNEGHEGNPRCLEVKLFRFSNEASLLRAYFKKVRTDSPDFLLFWNMKFDALTMINRMKHLGMNPEEHFCDEGLEPYNFVDYFNDDFTTDYIFKNDVLTTTSRTLWVDQMLLYAALRRHLAKRPSYALDAILNYEINEGKVKYEGSIRDFCRRDYPLFSIYAAIDVIASSTLEDKLGDVEFNHSLSHLTRTPFHDTMKKTRCLRNLAALYYQEKGFVLSNNRNAINRPLRPHFKGGFVSDPERMDKVGMEIGGEKSRKIFENVVDSDATSLYPSIFRTFNVDPSGSYGIITIQTKDGREMGADTLVEHLASGSRVETGRSLLGLPGLDETLRILETNQ